MSILIRGAEVVTPDGVQPLSVLIDEGRIAALDVAEHTEADEVVSAHGMHLLPGVVDDQVHFREPGLTHKEDLAHATRACAKGGVTTFLEMPNTRPACITQQGLEEKLAIAAEKSLVNYGFYIGATENNLEQLRSAHRTPGIKIFIGSSTGDLLVDGQTALEAIFAETTLPICAHCEDETTVRENAARHTGADIANHSRIRDRRAAVISATRTFDLARRHNHRFHLLHASTAEEPELAADHRDLITVEVCPHHLFFHVGDYERLGSRIQMNPAIKTADDNAALWRALHDGRVQVIATDHAPHTLEEKEQPYPQSPSGLPAVENSLALMLDQHNRGRCSLSQIAHWMADAPARVWDIVDKGRIAEGYDADLVLVDLQKTRRIEDAEQETKCRWSPWSGQTLQGWPVRTWVRGREVFRDGQIDSRVRGDEARYDHARGGYWRTA